MGKRRSGPEGPDRDPEPFENATPEAALEHHRRQSDSVQASLDVLFAQYADALEGIDRKKIVFDSDWECMGKLSLRVIMAEGPPKAELDQFLQRLWSESGDLTEVVR